jgi:catechol 2,3-dioxygenase
LELAGDDDRGALIERLTARGIPVRDDGRLLSFDDPWNNEISAHAATD